MSTLRRRITWAARALGPRARVVRARPLRGGLTSTVHDLTIERNGARMHVVLRSYPACDEESAKLIRQEVDVLIGLAPTAIPTPEVLDADPNGSEAGIPSLLMSRLPGRIHLVPRDPERWIRELAWHLCAIHELPPIGEPFERHWIQMSTLSPPAWSHRKELWDRAITAAVDPPEPKRLRMHGDYQHFNVLWTRERITGVLDWVWSWNGPFELDVGHCRLNLAVLFSAEMAERFRAIYEKESGRTCDPRWDLASMMDYIGDGRWEEFIPNQVAGRAPVDVAGMNDRVEGLVARILDRS